MSGSSKYSLQAFFVSGIVGLLSIFALKFLPGTLGVLIFAFVIAVVLYYVGKQVLGPYAIRKYGPMATKLNLKDNMRNLGVSIALIISLLFWIAQKLNVVMQAYQLNQSAELFSSTVTLLMFIFWLFGYVGLLIGGSRAAA